MDIRESDPEQLTLRPHYPFRVLPRSVNKYRKDFCQPVTLAAQLFDSYTIDIAPSAISSKYF